MASTAIAAATPPPSFFGGLGLALSAHTLLALNGSVFGISGFLHQSLRGSKEAIVSVLGLIVGGALVGRLEAIGPPVGMSNTGSFARIITSGFLVGIGTKVWHSNQACLFF
jgi:uncharacterized protein